MLPNSLDSVDIIENTLICVLLFTFSYICTPSMLHRIKMPETYVVHLGNSKELMEVAEDSVAKRILREHVRESLGVRNEDLIFAIINSMLSLLMR